MKHITAILSALAAFTVRLPAADGVAYEPRPGTANGKQIVMLAGDEEYRGEEGLPMLGKILSQRHGFKCTVLFPINPADGTIDPNNQTNLPGMKALQAADLVINQFRFRELPDPDMKYFVDYLNSGKPMIVVRTGTHSFSYSRNKQSPYAKYHWQAKDGGFGGLTVGETWTFHHGNHGSEATRGLVDGRNQKHPIVRAVVDIFGPTDVYGVNADFPTDATVLVWGQTLRGMKPDDAPNLKKAIMPIVWLRDYKGETGNTSKILCSTIGAATDLESEDLRRLFVNACYFLTGFDVPKQADVAFVGDYKPTFFGFDKGKKGVKPADHELK
jgi:hypothetical protein